MIRDEELLEIAKIIYPKCIDSVQQVLWHGQSCGEKNPTTAASKMAIRYADELLRQYSKFKQLSFEDRKNF